MSFKFQEGTEFTLDEGVDTNKFLAIRDYNASNILEILKEYNYDLQVIPGHFLKMFTLDQKEAHELNAVLKEIEERGLKDIFNANLRVQVFKRSYLERVKYCLDNNIPFLNSDNTFVVMLDNPDSFAQYVQSTPVKEESNTKLDTENIKLDAEDEQVKYEIIKTLGEVNSSLNDPNVTKVVSSIITNLDEVIARDNKNYHFMGIRHLVEDALSKDVDPVMESILDTQILPLFPEDGMKRGKE